MADPVGQFRIEYTESEIAAELTDLLGEPYTRDRVHTIRLAAQRRLARATRQTMEMV